MKRIFFGGMAVLFALAAVSGLWAGGQRGAARGPAINRANFNNLGSYPLVKNQETITVMKTTGSLDQTMDQNWMTQFYEQKTNVRVNWIMIPTEQFRERVNLAMASGDQADLVVSAFGAGQIGQSEIMRFAAQQVILPIQDYIDSDTVNMKKALAEQPLWRQTITMPNGNIYALPSLNECLHCSYYGKMWVNTEFLKNVGLSIPRTPEEFRDMLRAFRDKDANGNGDPKDEIPFAAANEYGVYSAKVDTYLMSAFVYDDGMDRLYIDNGKVTAAFQQPGFREGLSYLRGLYGEGLIYPGSFTQSLTTRGQLNSQKYESVIGAIPYEHHGNLGSRETGQPVRWLDYDAIPPLKGPQGLQAARYDYYAKFQHFRTSFIPASSRNPALVLRWLDYFFDGGEGERTLVFGGKGIAWDDADRGTTGVDGSPAKFKTIPDREGDRWYQNRSWGQDFPNLNSAAMRGSEQTPFDWRAPDGSGVERMLFVKTTENYVPYGWAPEKQIPPLYYSDEAATEISLLKTNINTYVEESIAKFVTGALDPDRDWNSFQNSLNNLGLPRYLQLMQEAYNASAFARK
jgi:putative aldouronate transport system substrate-binding protein